MAQDPFEGFLRALSVAAGTHMPRIPAMRDSPRQSPRRGSRPSSQARLILLLLCIRVSLFFRSIEIKKEID